MTTRRNDSVFPHDIGSTDAGVPIYEGGITLREYAAISIMAGYRATGYSCAPDHAVFPCGNAWSDVTFRRAVNDADVLLAELERTKGGRDK